MSLTSGGLILFWQSDFPISPQAFCVEGDRLCLTSYPEHTVVVVGGREGRWVQPVRAYVSLVTVAGRRVVCWGGLPTRQEPNEAFTL